MKHRVSEIRSASAEIIDTTIPTACCRKATWASSSVAALRIQGLGKMFRRELTAVRASESWPDHHLSHHPATSNAQNRAEILDGPVKTSSWRTAPDALSNRRPAEPFAWWLLTDQRSRLQFSWRPSDLPQPPNRYQAPVSESPPQMARGVPKGVTADSVAPEPETPEPSA